MSFHSAEPTPPAVAATGTVISPPMNSHGLKIATIIFTSLAALGLISTVVLLLATAANSGNEEFGWYFGFSVTASIVNVIPAAVALILGFVGRRAGGAVSLTAIVVGAAVLVVLVGQLVFLLVA